MLSAVARSAARQLNAPIATASRNVYTLPIILSNARSYSAISEALEHSEAAEHPHPSSSSTTKRTGRPRKTLAEVAKAEKEKAKAKAQKEKEKGRLQAKKLAEKEKLKAKKAAEKEKLKAKELKEKEKLRAKNLAEKEKLKEKAPQLKEEAELVTAAQQLLAVPKSLSRVAISIYIGEKLKGNPSASSALADCAKSWHNEDSSVKAEYEARAEANVSANEAAFEEFIKSHKPIEIYNHNVAVRTLKAKGVSKNVLSNKKLNADKNVTYSEIKDPRIPKRPVPSYIQFYTEKTQERSADESLLDFNKKVTQEWKSLSGEEKKAYSEKQEAYRTDVYYPKMMELFGTITPSRIAYNFQPKGSAEVAA